MKEMIIGVFGERENEEFESLGMKELLVSFEKEKMKDSRVSWEKLK